MIFCNNFQRIQNILIVVLSIFLTSICGQSRPDASLSLDQIFFQLNNLKIDANLNDDSTGSASFSLNLFKIGFKDFSVSNDNTTTELKINGPNIELEDFELNTQYTLPNYYNIILSDLSDRRYEIPTDGIEILEKAIQTYKAKNNKFPSSFDDLVVDQFISADKYPFNHPEWSYQIKIPYTINAATTSMYKSSPKNLIFDWPTKKIINRESDKYQKEDINWNFNLKINDINQHFLSDLKIIIDPDNYNIDFFQKRGSFKINNININAIPNNNLFAQTIFRLHNVNMEINDLFLNLINLNQDPKIQNGRGEFSLRNFELKLPAELIIDETMKSIMKDLGVRNGLIRVRELGLNFHFYDDEFAILNFSFTSPFLKISLSGQMSLDKNNYNLLNSIQLFDTELKVSPISYGVRDIIRQWEIDNGKSLERDGPVIILKISGSLSNPTILGID